MNYIAFEMLFVVKRRYIYTFCIIIYFNSRLGSGFLCMSHVKLSNIPLGICLYIYETEFCTLSILERNSDKLVNFSEFKF